MSSGRLGAPARFLRNRFAVFVALLVAAASTVAMMVSRAATLELDETLDDNWRGGYDLLVTPPTQQLSVTTTGGLVEPNFIGFTGAGGISESNLGRIRRIAGVEVAAPIGMVGVLRYSGVAPTLHRTDASDTAKLYRLSVTVTVFDGLQDRLVHAATGLIAMGPGVGSAEVPVLSSLGPAGLSSDGLELALPFLPAIATPVVAVDPEAERALLGPTAGFLDALGTVPAEPARRVAEHFPAKLVLDQFEVARVALSTAPPAQQTPVIPMLVNVRSGVDLHINVGIEESVGELRTPVTMAPEVVAAANSTSFTPTGTTEVSADNALLPFDATSLVVAWPGSELPPSSSVTTLIAPSLEPVLTDRPGYVAKARRSGGAAAFDVVPRQVVTVEGTAISALDPRKQPSDPGLTVTSGRERAYRPTVVADSTLPAGEVVEQPYLAAPVGTFAVEDLELATDAISYVPYGAYDPAVATITKTPGGAPIEPTQLQPGLSGQGLVAAAPSAITDLVGGRTLRGDTPIDAVRVRVGGISGYDPAAAAKVAEIANAINDIGLHVDVVAGSSRQPVEVYVADYHVDGRSEADLGTVEQLWTTLGAAAVVENALSPVSGWLLALALLGVCCFTVAAQGAAVGVRRQEARTLRTVGWTRWQVRRRMLAETLVGAAVVVAAMGLGIWLGERSQLGLASAAILLLTYVGAYAVTVWLATGSPLWPSRAHQAVRRPGTTTLVRYALRTSFAHPVRLATVILALAVTGSTTCLGVLLVLTSARSAGPTLLGGAAADSLSWYHYWLLVVGVIAGLALLGTVQRLELAERRSEWRALWAAGWEARHQRRIIAVESIVRAVPGAVAAFAVSWLAIGTIFPAAPSATAMVAALVVVAVVLVGYRMRGNTRSG